MGITKSVELAVDLAKHACDASEKSIYASDQVSEFIKTVSRAIREATKEELEEKLT